MTPTADVFVGPPIQWSSLSPMLILLGVAVVLLVAAALTPRWPRRTYALVAVGGALAAVVVAVCLWHGRGLSAWSGSADPTTGSSDPVRFLVGGAMRFDAFALWLTVIVGLAVALSVLVTDDYLEREGLSRLAPEIYALYLTAGLGAVVMGMANDLIVLFLGLEILSLSLYVLAASHRRRTQSQESALKYFILGGVASAVFLYGVALIYGASGSTNYTRALAAFVQNISPHRSEAMALAGVGLLLVGLGFKAAAVPFHMWAPDVYQGAPTPVTGFMASAAKAGAFAAMLRVLVVALPTWSADYRPIVWVMAVLTLVVGSVMAVAQTNVKRMLAFSSISHAGFLLVGVEAAIHDTTHAHPGDGVPSTMLYLLLYAVLVIGTFAVVTLVGRTGDGATDLAGFRGLARQRPVLAVAMTVLLVAQAGVPLTSGFVAKFGVITAAVGEHSYALAIIAMVAAVIAAYLYLRIMISMWVAEPDAADAGREPVGTPLLTSIVIAIAVAVTVVVGVAPGWLISLAQHVR